MPVLSATIWMCVPQSNSMFQLDKNLFNIAVMLLHHLQAWWGAKFHHFKTVEKWKICWQCCWIVCLVSFDIPHNLFSMHLHWCTGSPMLPPIQMHNQRKKLDHGALVVFLSSNQNFIVLFIVKDDFGVHLWQKEAHLADAPTVCHTWHQQLSCHEPCGKHLADPSPPACSQNHCHVQMSIDFTVSWHWFTFPLVAPAKPGFWNLQAWTFQGLIQAKAKEEELMKFCWIVVWASFLATKALNSVGVTVHLDELEQRLFASSCSKCQTSLFFFSHSWLVINFLDWRSRVNISWQWFDPFSMCAVQKCCCFGHALVLTIF